MSVEFQTKINKLLQKSPKGAVLTDSWLKKNDVSTQLKHRYIASHWLEPIGHGAAKRSGDNIDWPGAVWALSQQGLKVHVGGKTALALRGLAHFVRANETTILFKESSTNIPKWFFDAFSAKIVRLENTSFIHGQFGVSPFSIGDLEIPVSQAERAILEVLFCVGKTETFEESSLLLEGMTGLRPSILQELLASCKSVKAKRLLLFFGEHHHHGWFKKLDLTKINLGAGTRQIVKNGAYDAKYKITVPKGYLINEENVY